MIISNLINNKESQQHAYLFYIFFIHILFFGLF